MTQEIVWHYLTPLEVDFWRWEDQGEVVAWKEQLETIAFRAELVNVLERLAPSGLPPLSAVLMLLAACRDEWDFTSCGAFLHSLRPKEPFPKLDALLAIHNLPRDLRTDAVARAEIAAAAFERPNFRCTPELSHEIVRQLRAGLPEVFRNPRSNGRDYYSAAFGLLAKGLQHVTAEKLRLRLQASVDDVPILAELVLPRVESVRALLQAHGDDEVIGGVVRLTKRVLAALSLPRPLSDHHDLPLGGVSDITNRGSLDRLLISELAHDDLTLAVRVAVNEALYLRRETPPRARPRARTILIDQGLRMWGLPRVYAAAIATALAAAADPQGELHVFRSGPELAAVDLSTRDGMIELLEQLQIERHPGKLLADFHERAQSVGAGDHVLITTADTLTDRDFLPYWLDFSEEPLFVVAVDRAGGLTLLQRSPAGTKTIRELRLSLDDITAPGRERPASPLERGNSPLPAALRQNPFPLRLPLTFVAERSWRLAGRGVLQTTKDGRLMLHENDAARPFGARQLADGVTGSAILWAVSATSGFSVVIGSKQHAQATLYHYEDLRGGQEPIPLILNGVPFDAVCNHNETLFVVQSRTVDAFSLPSGRKRDQIELPHGTSYRGQRFFRSQSGQWLALSYNGERIVLEPILSRHNVNAPPMREVFESASVEGPLALVWPCRLYMTAEGEIREFRHAGKDIAGQLLDHRVRLSADTERVLLPARCPSTSKRFAAHVARLPEVLLLDENQSDQFLDPSLGRTGHWQPSLRVHFTHIGIRSGNELMLRPRRGPWLQLWLNKSAGRLQLRTCASAIQPDAVQPFDECSFERRRLREARWANGTRAFLDHRGLLHLAGRSPEITLVLEESHVSGWIQVQDGLYFGDLYFTGQTEGNISAVDALQKFITPWTAEADA